MKLFEEFESDLRDVNSLKDLVRMMLANGVKGIKIDSMGVQIETTPYGLVEAVPIEQWEVLKCPYFEKHVGVKKGTLEIFCYVQEYGEKAFTEITGFEFPEVEE